MAEFEIAEGHDEVGDLVPLYELDTVNGLFWQYALGTPKSVWHSEESLREDGARFKQRVSLPYVTLELARVTEAEAELLETLVGPVTIAARKKHADTWANFNANMWPIEWGEFEQKEGCFLDVVVEFRALREIIP